MLLLLGTLVPAKLFAQNAANYAAPSGTFTSVIGTFTSIATTGTAVTYAPSSLYDPKDEGGTNPIPLGFDMTLFGNQYSYCVAYANGYLAFAPSPDVGTFHGPFTLAGSQNSHPIIAPYWADIEAQTNVLYYQTSGTAPNRVFTVEWPNMGVWQFQSPASFSFQAKMYEANGQVELIYDSLPGTQSSLATIGLSAGISNYLGLNNTSTTPVPSTTTGVTTVAGKPASGQIYRFVPPPANTGSGFTFGSFSIIGSNSLTFNWTHTTPASTGFYKIERAVSPFTDYTLIGTVPVGTNSYTATGLTPATQYKFRIIPANEGFANIAAAAITPTQSTASCGPLTGTLTVGPTGSYATLTAFITDMNLKGVNGSLIIELQPTYSAGGETFPITFTDFKLHSCTSPSANVTIRPQTGATGLQIVSDSVATIMINGADYLTIDGRPGGTGSARQLSIGNRTATGTAITLLNDAIGNTIRWCDVRSSNTSATGGSLLIGSTLSASSKGNDSNTISNCYFSSLSTGSYVNGITSIGFSAVAQNNNNTITNNAFNNFQTTGVNIPTSTSGPNWVISGNSFYDTAISVGSGPWTAINFIPTASSVNNVVNLNYIGGTAPQCGGSAMQTNRAGLQGASVYTGILFTCANGTQSTIYGNTIRNIALINPLDSSNFRGIVTTTGTLVVDSNTIGDANPANFPSILSFANAAVEGLNLSPSTAFTASRNTIAGIRSTTAGTSGGIRAILMAGSSAPFVINNIIKNLHTNAPNTGNYVTGGMMGIVSTSTGVLTISGNTIGGGIAEPLRNANNTAVVVKINGIGINGGTAIIQNNTINGLIIDSTINTTSNSTTSAMINGILNGSTVAGQVVQGNTIRNLRDAYATTAHISQVNAVCFIGAGANADITGNVIGNLFTKSGYTGTATAAALTAINCAAAANYNVSGNYIDSLVLSSVTAAVTQSHGIVVVSTATDVNITNNTIKTIISGGNTGVPSIAGIYSVSTAAISQNIEGNSIYNLVNTNATTASVISGIYFTGSSTVALNNSFIQRNFVHSLRTASTSTSSTVHGINLVGGLANLVNNMIRIGVDSNGAPTTNPTIINGIAVPTTAAGPVNIYHNSVFIGAKPTSGTSATLMCGIHVSASANPIVDIRNNILYVDSGGSATAPHYALRVYTTATGNSNYNLLYSPSSTLGYVAAVISPTAAAYTSLFGTTGWRYAQKRDAQSATGNPNFVLSSGNSQTVNLRLQSPTLAEGMGIAEPNFLVTTDFDGNSRNSFTGVDVGANAGNYTLAADSFAPGIIYAPLPNIESTGNRTLVATITDPKGVYTNPGSGLVPRLYFRKNFAGTPFSTDGILTGGNSRNGTWNFTFNYSLLGGVTAGDSIYYYIVAQDSSNLISFNPPNGIATDVNTILNVPSAMNTYKIITAVGQTVTIGATGTYTNLTGPAGLFNAINNGLLQGHTTALLDAGTISEPGTVQLSQWQETNGSQVSNYNYTLTVQPATNAQTILSGNVTSSLIVLNGADRVKFSGISPTGSATDTNLIIRQVNTANSAVMLQNDACGNVFQNVIFEGIANVFNNSATSLSTGNDNLTITGCIFRPVGAPGSMATVLFVSTGTVDRENDTLLIANSTFYNFTTTAISIAANHGDLIRLKGNSIFNQYPTAVACIPINFIPGAISNFDTITGNFIGGTAPLAAGAQFSVTSVAFTGITQSVGTSSGVYNAGNTIKNIVNTGTAGAITGITITAGAGVIQNNNIGDSLVSGSITSGASALTTGISSTTTGSINISGNTVANITNNNPGGTAVRIVGISVTSSTNVEVISNNRVQGFSVNSASTGATTASALMGIYNTSTASSLSIQNNSVKNLVNTSQLGTYEEMGIYNSAGPAIITGNLVEGLYSSSQSVGTTTSSAVIGIANASSAALQISGNTVRNLNYYHPVPTAAKVVGLITTTGSGLQVTDNLIHSLTSNSICPDTINTSAVIGLYSVVTGTNILVSRNTVFALRDTTSQDTVSVMGIYFSGPTAGNNFVTRNSVHSLGLTTTGQAWMTGLYYAAGVTTIANNMIRIGIDSAGNPFTGAYVVSGIYAVQSTTSTVINRYLHNTVYLGGQPTSGTSITAAFNMKGNTSTSDNPKQDIRNNIFVNAVSNNGGGGVNFVMRINGVRSIFPDYNLYYAPGVGAMLVGVVTPVIPVSNYSSLRGTNSWNFYTNKDLNSAVGNPNFINATGSATQVNLRLQSSNPCESSGDTSTNVWITDDIDGNLRSGLTHADIGAHSGNFTISTDLFPPKIAYTNLGNSGNLTGPFTMSGVTITDRVAVQRTGANRPRVYYKKGPLGTYASVPSSSFTGTATNATFTFNIDYSLIGGVTTGTIIYYYVIAQDSLGGNVISEPTVVVASNVNTVLVHPEALNNYLLLPSIASGTKFYVGAGKTFTNLTGNTGLFSYLNQNTINGNITAVITSDLVEPGTNALNELGQQGSGAGTYTITIRPDSSAISERIVSGTSTGTMIGLNGCDRVKILGIPDTSTNTSLSRLRFRNSGTGSTIGFANDATGCLIRNCAIEGASTSGVVLFSGTAYTQGNSNDTITGCTFSNNTTMVQPAGVPTNMINSTSTSVALNNNVVITNNQFSNFAATAINTEAGTGNGWIISNNHIFSTLVAYPTAAVGAIRFNSGVLSGGHLVSNNFIGGQTINAGGSPWIHSVASDWRGIVFNGSTTLASTITNNTIQNLSMANSTANVFNGIYVTNGTLTISNNLVGHPSNTNSISISFAGVSNGINVISMTAASGNVNVNGNTIQGIYANNPSGAAGFNGINIAGGIPAVSNNTIGHPSVANSIRLEGTSGLTGIVSSLVNSQSAAISITGNNIYNLNASNSNNTTSACGILFTGTAIPTITGNTIRSINSNSQSTLATGTLAASGIAFSSTTASPAGGLISQNVISAISADNAGNLITHASGISIGGAGVNSASVTRNRIFDIRNASTAVSLSPSATANGISIGTIVADLAVQNNQITLGIGQGNNVQYNGIWQSVSGAFSINATYNSVFVSGINVSGNNPSFAYHRGSNSNAEVTSIVRLVNNALINNRSGGTAKNYAVANEAGGAVAGTGWQISSNNYNFFSSADANTLGLWGTVDKTFTTWQLSSVTDANSWSLFNTGSGALNPANLFTNAVTGDLSVKTANPEAWYLNGKGVAGSLSSWILPDYEGNNRDTVYGFGTDIGSQQFVPTSNPPLCIETGTIGVGNTTTYTFAGRTIASINWGTGSMPATATMRYYSGTNPPALLAAKKYFNCYWDVQYSGSGFTTDILLNYDPALVGNMVSENNALVAFRNTSWHYRLGSVVNTSNKTVLSGTGGTIGSGSLISYAITDLTAPLPVEFLRFNAKKKNADVVLSWSTAGEENNAGFGIERSGNGIEFKEVFFMDGTGSSSQQTDYLYNDENAFGKEGSLSLYYRLRQVDGDGRVSYSAIVKVDENEKATDQTRIYPNPFTDHLSVSLFASTSGKAELSFTDIQGRVLRTAMFDLKSGVNILEIPETESIQTGVYLVSVNIEGAITTLKVIKR